MTDTYKWSHISSEVKASVHQEGTMCQCCMRILLEPGKELTGAPTVSLTTGPVWAPKVPLTLLVICETQPVYFAPQYNTRYPFYRWEGWWASAEVLVMFFPLLWDSNRYPLGYMYKPKTLLVKPSARSPTHPAARPPARTRTHTPE